MACLTKTTKSWTVHHPACGSADPSGCIHRETWGMVWDLMLELTINSPYLIVDSKIQLSTPTTTSADKCFPKWEKMEQQIGKGRVRGWGREGVGADLMS
jgi:hypothetical protein